MTKSEPLNSFQHKIIALAFILFISVLAINSALAAGIDASIDRTEVALGDSFNLRLSVDTNNISQLPDLAPLSIDFDILGTSQSSQTQIINGNRIDTFNWVITLTPKQTGDLLIPAIGVGAQSSQTIPVKVLESSSMNSSAFNNKQLSINVEVEPGTYHIHEEFPLTVTIIDRIGIKNASLSEYNGDDFVIKQSGKDNISQIEIDGQMATKIERKYLMKSLKSGQLVFPSLTLSARAPSPQRRSSLFGSNDFSSLFDQLGASGSLFDEVLNPGKKIITKSLPLTFDIKAHPNSENSWFLPAKEVKLVASFNPDNPEFKVGEAVTRTVKLFALGASPEQLPDIEFSNPEGANIYIDNTDVKSMDTDQGTAAIKEYVTSIVPTGSGEIELSAIEIKWWDTEKDEEKIATLPSMKINATGAIKQNESAISNISQVLTNEIEEPKNNSQPTNDTPDLSTKLIQLANHNGIKEVLTFCIALFFIAMLLLFMRRKPENSADKTSNHQFKTTEEKSSKLSNLYCEVEIACLKDDPQHAYTATMNWLTLLQPNEKVSADVLHEVSNIERQLYSDQISDQWSGKTLLAAVKALKVKTRKSKASVSTQKLLPLYPTSFS